MAASHAYPWAARPASQPGWPPAAARAGLRGVRRHPPRFGIRRAGQVTQLLHFSHARSYCCPSSSCAPLAANPASIRACAAPYTPTPP